jgi:hypothetical protein
MQTTPFLKNSSYVYLGKFQVGCSPGHYPPQNPGIRNYKSAPQKLVFLKSSAASKRLKRQIASVNAAGTHHSVIVSAEEFEAMPLRDEETWDLLKDTLSLYKGRTHVIATYRHSHETIVSGYFETFVGRSARKQWRDKDIISFPMYWRSEQIKIKGRQRSNLIASFEQHSFNVTVVNFHGDSESGDDLVTRFLCGLPHANATCEAYKNDAALRGKDAAAVSRVSLKSYAQYDRITKAAQRKGMFSTYNLQELNRYNVTLAIQDRVEMHLGMTFTDLPQVCLNEEEINEILALSIQYGRGVFKDDFDENELRKSFHRYKRKKSFCAVDVDAVISDDAWAQFLTYGLRV